MSERSGQANSEIVLEAVICELRSPEGAFSVAQLANLELAARERKFREMAALNPRTPQREANG